MSRKHWFVPEDSNVVVLLGRQIDATLHGLDALAHWAGGDASAAAEVRATEALGDAAKQEVLTEVTDSFVTPIEPEDLFALSQGIDSLLNRSRDLVNEAEAMGVPPDATLAQMAELLRDSLRSVAAAVAHLTSDPDAATESANAAIQTERGLERVYYEGMAALLENPDQRERIAKRELYRLIARLGEAEVEVAERVIYAVMKER